MRERPPAPPALRTATIDAHCHLDLQTQGAPDSAVVRHALDEAAHVGVDRIIQVGVDLDSSQWSVACAEAWPGRVVAAVALHPNDAPHLTDLDDALVCIEQMAQSPRVRAIGETGLDHFRTGPELHERQEYSFRAHIEIAKRTGKVLMIHDRDAHDDVLRVLREVGAPDQVIFHCFSGDEQMAEECIRAGYLLSFAGTVTFKNARNLHDALAIAPLDRILVETDAPYLTPMPHRGAPNASYLIPHTIRFMAERKGVSEEEVAGAISATAESVVGPF